MTGKNRRTLSYINFYPTPKELYNNIVKSDGWPYKTEMKFYRTRDKALVSLLYLLALRVSEALRLKKEQFLIEKSRVVVRGIKLSKSVRKDKPRKEQYRQVGYLPLTKDRGLITGLVLEHLEQIETEDKLFKFGIVRAWQITTAILKIPNHWLRAYGEDFLYSMWRGDLLAVADYVKVDPRTLQHYIRKRFERYPVV